MLFVFGRAASPKECLNSTKAACGAVVIGGVLLYSVGPDLLPPQWGGRRRRKDGDAAASSKSSGHGGGGGGGGSDTTERLIHTSESTE